MSSIRPLVTITVLALVGVFLYWKINETEPPLPEGVEDWSADTDLQVDMEGIDPAASPQFAMAPAGSESPPYSPEAALGNTPVAPALGDTAPPYNADAAAAPTWSEAPTNNKVPPVAVASRPSLEVAESKDTSGAMPALPDLPPLPTLPPAPSTAPSVDRVAGGVSPMMSAKNQATLAAGALIPAVTESLSSSTPAVTSPENNAAQAQSSLFSATRLAVQAALDRGELSQALLLLSDWHGDPSLSTSESGEVNLLLGQLAGSVIYSTEHRLEPPYMVQAGERLETIAKEYDVPWQLLAKINGITSADQLQPGQQLKVVRGPFSALVDLGQRKLTLMLDRRYAGQFSLDIEPSVTVEEGHWEVNQKLLTPANVSLQGTGPTTPTEERSLMLSNASGGATQVAILRGAKTTNPLDKSAGRVLRMNPTDAADVFDILSLGSKVVIRR